jgi:hypothetical protein
MISTFSRLIRTELESYLHDVVLWGGTVFFVLLLFFSFIGTTVVMPPANHSSARLGQFLLAVGLSSVLVAVKVSSRNAIEKRNRLFSQLPVSTREVSFASWCLRLLYLLVPSIAFTLFIARVANMQFGKFALVALATYLGGLTLVAAISVAMNVRHLPPPIAALARGAYITCAIVAVGIWFLGNLLVTPPSGSDAIGGLADVGLPGLTGLLTVSSVGLVVLDVWLRDHADNYLE